MITIRKALLLSSALMAMSAPAATTTYTFGGTGNDVNGVQSSAGKAFQNSTSSTFGGPGVIAFGYFTINDAAITTAATPATLVSAFQNWNTNGTSTFASAGPGTTATRGVFTFNAAARDLQTGGSGEAFQGKTMYAFIGNGTTFTLSTEFLVVKTTYTFDAGESGVAAFLKPLSYAVTAPSGVLLGSQVANVVTSGSDTTTTPGWQTAAPRRGNRPGSGPIYSTARWSANICRLLTKSCPRRSLAASAAASRAAGKGTRCRWAASRPSS